MDEIVGRRIWPSALFTTMSSVSSSPTGMRERFTEVSMVTSADASPVKKEKNTRKMKAFFIPTILPLPVLFRHSADMIARMLSATFETERLLFLVFQSLQDLLGARFGLAFWLFFLLSLL